MLNEQPKFFDEHDVAYLDNAATTQKPDRVLSTLQGFYESTNANPHRGMYDVANEATEAVEQAREQYAKALNAEDKEIFFTRNATESLNQLVQGFRHRVDETSNVVTTRLEHHSSLLPLQQLREQTGCEIRIIEQHQIDDYTSFIDGDTELIMVTHMSNVTGRILPISDMASYAHTNSGAVVIVDGCQAYPHMSVDVNQLKIDAYTFSAHKHYGPTGVGITYLNSQRHEDYEVSVRGGGMVDSVSEQDATYSQAPHKFEAGTLNAAGIVAAGEACDMLEENREAVEEHEQNILRYGLEQLDNLGVDVYGHANDRYGPVISLDVDTDGFDIAHILNEHGVCIRAGNHCADPLMNALNTSNTARISIGYYNTEDDIDRLINALQDAKGLLGGAL